MHFKIVLKIVYYGFFKKGFKVSLNAKKKYTYTEKNRKKSKLKIILI